MKNTISEVKNALEVIKSSLDEAEHQISKLEDKIGKIPSLSNKKKVLKKNEDGFRQLQENMKCNNIHTIGIAEREEKWQRIENLFFIHDIDDPSLSFPSCPMDKVKAGKG